MGLHIPQRLAGESFSDYQFRRAQSNATVRLSQRDPNYGLVGSRRKYRDEMRKSGAMGKRIRAADALVAAWASKRVSKEMNMGPKDERGAFTYTGQNPRRVWVAGLSAQRGY